MSRSGAPLYHSRLVGAGVWLLASGAVLCVLMLIGTVGPFRFAVARGAEAHGIGLWEAPSPHPDSSRLRVAAWRRIVPEDWPLRVDRNFASLRAAGVAVIAVPDARALGDADLAALRDFARAGGGIVLAGSVAVETPLGEWRGYEAMAQLLEVERVFPLERTYSQAFVARARGPLTAPLLPGERIALVPEAGVPALAEESPELCWDSDPTEAASGPERPRAAARRLQLGSGRLVWLAAGPESAQGGLDAHLPIAGLLRAALSWAAGDPVLEVVPVDWTPTASGDAARAQWQELRKALAASALRAGPNRLLVNLTNRSDQLLRAKLRLHGIPSGRETRMAATELFQPLPTAHRERDSDTLEIALPELPGGESQSFYVDFEARDGV